MPKQLRQSAVKKTTILLRDVILDIQAYCKIDVIAFRLLVESGISWTKCVFWKIKRKNTRGHSHKFHFSKFSVPARNVALRLIL